MLISLNRAIREEVHGKVHHYGKVNYLWHGMLPLCPRKLSARTVCWCPAVQHARHASQQLMQR